MLQHDPHHPWKREEVQKRENGLKRLNNKAWLIDQHYNHKKTLKQIADELGVDPKTITNRCKDYNIEVSYFSGPSQEEKSISAFIRRYYDGEIVENTRKLIPPHEIDIYLPDLNLAIEYNGLYWHSENVGKKDKHYHLKKTNACEKLGIRLLHIYGGDRMPVIELLLKKIIGRYEVIDSNKCSIEEIPDDEAEVFLNKYHLQSYTKASIHLGLYCEEGLRFVMSFKKSKSAKYSWELVRLCSDESIVTDGGEKLLHHFRKSNRGPIISYCDRSWNSGRSHKDLGFVQKGTSTPDYWYIIGKTLTSKSKYQKNRMENKLKHFDPILTEWQNMQANNIDRIWDCGQKIFLLP